MVCETDQMTSESVPNSVTPLSKKTMRGNLNSTGCSVGCICYMCTAVPLAVGVTVDPDINTYTLGDLKSDTEYEVQVSGFTRVGEGVRSRASHFSTNQYQGCAEQHLLAIEKKTGFPKTFCAF